MDGQEPPALAEFINHPSFRQTATFFLGFVFISCIHYSYHVPMAAAHRLRSRFMQRRGVAGQRELGLEANHPYGDEKVHTWLGKSYTDHASTLSSTPESYNIALSLTLCFAMASIAEFGSLIVFDRKAQAGCAFLVAWGGMSGQAARLLGLLKLSLDLRKMGVHRWETFIFWSWLIFGLVIMFVSNAISIGTIEEIPTMPGSGLCFRRHYLATAVVSSAVNIVLEVYCLVRVTYLLVPPFLSTKHQIDAVFDVRSFRALSLLILDIASAVPAAKFFSVLTDVIPASLGTLLVLAAFNARSPNVSLPPTASIPPTRADSAQSRSTIEIKKMPSLISITNYDGRVSHPFAARALQDPAPETEDWTETASPDHIEKSYIPTGAVPAVPIPAELAVPAPVAQQQNWRTSTQSSIKSSYTGTSETDSDIAHSVKGAVVAFAFKDNLRRKSRERRSFLPRIPRMAEVPHAQAQTLPRSTPLRIPKPIVAPPSQHVAALERASEDSLLLSASAATTAPRPTIAITTESPSAELAALALPSPQTHSSNSRSRSHSHSGTSVSASKTSSLHLTPSTPSGPQSSWRDSQTSSQEPGDTESARRQSGASSARLPPADDDLSIVYEASHEDSESIPPSRAHRPTFGEDMFVQGGIARLGTPPVEDGMQDVPQDVGAEDPEGASNQGSNRSETSIGRI